MAQQRGPRSEHDDPFESLLREIARASTAPVSSGPTLRTGTTIASGRLHVVRRLGEGGMGIVYEAQDDARDCRVALKTLHRMGAADIYRFKNEFRALADVVHDHLVKLHELFSTEEGWFYTMELVDGVPFDRYTRPDGGPSEARLRAVLPDLLSAVRAIHRAGKLHRDLKPNNVLVTHEGRVVVLDFGLVIEPGVGGIGRTLVDHGVSGTPAYMAPEQAQGLAGTTASDAYGIGVMLFEALTGRLPFEGAPHEMLSAKQRHEAPHATSIVADAPADLAALCAALLSRDPAARPDLESLCARFDARAPTGSAPPGSGSASMAPSAEPLLGRNAELKTLLHAYAETRTGSAIAFLISGESGMGKTALVAELLRCVNAQGHAVVLASRCYERENVPFKAFDGLVDELSRYLRKLPDAEAAALLPRDIGALSRLFPVLDRVSAIAEAPRREVADVTVLRERACSAFGELLARIRDRRPLVLAIDDLQWSDQDSVTFLRLLLSQQDAIPALLVAAHRSEGAEDNPHLQALRRALAGHRDVEARELRVGPLSDEACTKLIGRLLGEGADANGAHALAREAGGIPYFAIELARAARCGAELPLSLREALMARVAALSPPQNRLLQILAFAGQPLPEAQALQAPCCGSYAVLDALRAMLLIRSASVGEDRRRVECYHDRLREHLVEAFDAGLQQELARGLARALEETRDPNLELLSRCLREAGERTAAGRAAARAAALASEALAFDRAARLYEQALALGEHDDHDRQELRVAYARALHHAGRGVDAGEAYLEASQHADGDARHALRQEAAKLFLYSGRMTRGRGLMIEILKRRGVHVPHSMGRVLLGIAVQEVLLRIRGDRFELRDDVAPSVIASLETMHTAVNAFARSEQFYAIQLSSRYLREALATGARRHVCRAIAWRVHHSALMHVAPERHRELSDLSMAMAMEAKDFEALELVYFTRGLFEWLWNDVDASLHWFDRLDQLVYEHGLPDASFNRAFANGTRVALFSYGRGEFARAAQLAAKAAEDCRLRGDLVAAVQPFYFGAASRVAVGQLEEAIRELELLTRAWESPQLSMQDQFLSHQRASFELLQGRVELAASIAEESVRRALATAFRYLPYSYNMAAMLAGKANVRLALDAPTAAGRRTALEKASQMLRLVRRVKRAPIGAWGDFLEAAIWWARGDEARSVTLMRKGLEPGRFGWSEGAVPIFQLMLARRLGGDEGRALEQGALAKLRAGGVVDPDSLVRFVAGDV